MTDSRRQRPTLTLLSKIKREAKASVRGTGITHTEALEQQARAAGYDSWHHLQQAAAQLVEADVIDFPVDPHLTANFDCTPNDERSRKELDAWWDRPYAVTDSDGRLQVRCLDGGAWDRSSSYGIAENLAEARELATRKLAEWKALRSRPVAVMTEDGHVLVVRRASRPDQEDEVLYEAADFEDAGRWLRNQQGEGGDFVEGRPPRSS